MIIMSYCEKPAIILLQHNCNKKNSIYKFKSPKNGTLRKKKMIATNPASGATL